MCMILAGTAMAAAPGAALSTGTIFTALGFDLAITGALAGAGMGIYSSMQSGKFNRDMARYQSKLNTQRAARAEQAGQQEAQQESLRRRQLIASGKTSFAANGVLLDSAPASAPNLWEQDQAAQLAYDRQVILDNAAAEAWGFSTQSKMDKANAGMAMNSAKYQAWASGISGAASAAGSAASYTAHRSALTA